MRWLWPKAIRGQLVLGLVLLETVFLLLFSVLLLTQERAGVHKRAARRLENQSTLLSVEASRSLESHHSEWLKEELPALLASRAIYAVRITDVAGKVLAQESKAPSGVSWKIQQRDLEQAKNGAVVLPFETTGDRGEGVAPLKSGNKLEGYAWVMEDPAGDRETIDSLLRNMLLFGFLSLLGCVALSTLLAQSISRPLGVLMAATRRLIRDPETKEGFPLVIPQTNEAAEVAEAFNLLVASMAEQRMGLSDTLALLDSMLANAPVGFAFFDREYRYVRVNRFLAEASGIPVQDYLGHSIVDFFADPAASVLAKHIDQIFNSGEDTRDLQLTDEAADFKRGATRTWVVNLYPVRVGSESIRWAGAVFIDATERKKAEDALRKSEKLAATGRLAASIAHEINNPLESVTNLLYLLRTQPSLDAESRGFAELAEQEVGRVSEMAQRTLRFYRQSTLPIEANLADVLDSVLTVHKGRFLAKHIDVDCRFDRGVTLYSFAGELRQVFANLIGNALDASYEGGKMFLRLRRCVNGKTGRPGIRVTVADTGSGMTEVVRRRIFEPFYTTKDETGTGLGLWISNEILGKHGATVAVKSKAKVTGDGHSNGIARSSGTVFVLFFPDGGIGRGAEKASSVPELV